MQTQYTNSVSDNTTIHVTVLDSIPWKTGQELIKMSEDDYVSNKIDDRKRHNNLKPEFWVYVCTFSEKRIKGPIELVIVMNKGSLNYRIKTEYDEHLLACQEYRKIQSNNKLRIHGDDIYRKIAQKIINSAQYPIASEMIKDVIEEIENHVSSQTHECPPHKFIANSHLSLLFCEKCGKTKPILAC
jgi:hypothetical protein